MGRFVDIQRKRSHFLLAGVSFRDRFTLTPKAPYLSWLRFRQEGADLLWVSSEFYRCPARALHPSLRIPHSSTLSSGSCVQAQDFCRQDREQEGGRPEEPTAEWSAGSESAPPGLRWVFSPTTHQLYTLEHFPGLFDLRLERERKHKNLIYMMIVRIKRKWVVMPGTW